MLYLKEKSMTRTLHKHGSLTKTLEQIQTVREITMNDKMYCTFGKESERALSGANEYMRIKSAETWKKHGLSEIMSADGKFQRWPNEAMLRPDMTLKALKAKYHTHSKNYHTDIDWAVRVLFLIFAEVRAAPRFAAQAVAGEGGKPSGATTYPSGLGFEVVLFPQELHSPKGMHEDLTIIPGQQFSFTMDGEFDGGFKPNHKDMVHLVRLWTYILPPKYFISPNRRHIGEEKLSDGKLRKLYAATGYVRTADAYGMLSIPHTTNCNSDTNLNSNIHDSVEYLMDMVKRNWGKFEEAIEFSSAGV